MSSDGEQLGKVAEVRGDLFRVDTSMAPDFWLQRSCVSWADASYVRIAYAASDVQSHKVRAPAGA